MMDDEKINRKDLKEKTEAGDPIACYDLGLSFKGKNHRKLQEYLFMSARMGYRPAMIALAEFYISKRSLAESLDINQSIDLNDFACVLIKEKEDKNYQKTAYTLFRIASKVNTDAMCSYVYCKFEGIGVQKNKRVAFELLYEHKLGDEFIVLKSTTEDGFCYKPKKSKVAEIVKCKRTRDGLTSFLKNVFLIIFGGPSILAIAYGMQCEYEIKTSGAYDTEESLRSNAVGGACLAAFVSFAWSYLLCSALSALILYEVGIEYYWKWGFALGILGSWFVTPIILINICGSDRK